MDYIVQEDPWFSPIEIVNRFEQLRSVFGSHIEKDPPFKRAREMFSAAVALLGAYELSPENKYYLQSNNQSASPDVMAAKQTEREGAGILLEMNQMEVTELENHYRSDDIVAFLEEKKLNKGYGEHMMIVCLVNRMMPVDHRAIYEGLKTLKPKSTIYIVGRPIDASPGTFSIFTPWPMLTKPFIYNLDQTASKYRLPERVNFHLDIAHKIKLSPHEAKPLNVYDILGLDQADMYRFYRIGQEAT